MEHREAWLMSQRSLLVIAGIQLVLVLVAGSVWLWSTWWHMAAVGAMTEELARAGALDLDAFARFSGRDANAFAVTEYLQQGHERRAHTLGLILCAVALAGVALNVLAAVERPRREVAPQVQADRAVDAGNREGRPVA